MPVRYANRPLVFLALAAIIAVAGCGKQPAADTAQAGTTAPLPRLPATLPMTTGAPTATAYAPAVAALPAARPIRTVRLANSGDAYAYADDAYAFSHAVGNAPPDYGFAYQGAEPWAWQGYDESQTFVEPVADGYRYYYYRPGAATPYFVRDPDYGYGYDNGSLAVIYGAGGAILPYADYGPRLGYASRYLRRGEDLYRASRGNDRRAVNAANWAARQNAIAASRDRWAAGEARQAGWQAYRARVADQQAQHWAQEAARRDADAQRFATWHDDGFRGAPPPRAIPAAWRRAPWAQDQQRYRVADRGPTAPPPVLAPQTADRQQGLPDQRRLQRLVETRPPGGASDQRVAPDTARVQRQTARIDEQQQRTAIDAQQHARPLQAASRAQQRVERQQVEPTRQAQVERAPRATADRRQDAARQTDRQQQAPVHIHRGGGDPSEASRTPIDPQRSPSPLRARPPQDDQRQADRQQHQTMHQEQQAIHQEQQAVHQQQTAVHQQAAVQHFAQPAQHASAPPRAAPAPHPAAAAHAGSAPHAQGGERGGHH